MDQWADFAKQGTGWALFVAALGVILFLYKSREALQTARMGDWKEIADTVKANSIVMRDWVTANESRTRALEATAKAQELAALSHTNLANEVGRLAETIKESRQSNLEMREALLSKGIHL